MYIPRKVLIPLLALSSVALIGFGTWAAFTAAATNPSNVFDNGTLVLSVTKGAGSACFSTGGGSTDTNANGSCDVVFSESVKKPGDEAVSDVLTVKNEGSIDAATFKLFTTSCTNANSTGESYHGTGDPCSKLQIYIQQFSDSGGTTPSACLYGGGTATTCDFSDAAKTIAAFATAHPDATNGLSASGLNAGASKYFKVGVKLPSDANNSFQGRKATWDLNWYLEQ